MNAEQGQHMVELARKTIEAALAEVAMESRYDPWLQVPGATFVTLTLRGELRGCIGSLEARQPLIEDLRENALAAAFRDPRFPPLTHQEATRIRVEVSLLSPMSPLVFSTEAEALAALRPAIDGLVVECPGHRATFLPQVWEQLPEPRVFLARLKEKAGLPRNFWSPELRLMRYTVENWWEPPR